MYPFPTAVAAIGDAARNVPTMPRLHLASGSFTRQLGGGSATYASTVALIFLVIPASEPESWAAFCVVLRCAITSLLSIRANASQGPVSAHGVTAQTRRLCCDAPAKNNPPRRECFPAGRACHIKEVLLLLYNCFLHLVSDTDDVRAGSHMNGACVAAVNQCASHVIHGHFGFRAGDAQHAVRADGLPCAGAGRSGRWR